MSIGSHHSQRMGSSEWITPIELISSLGVFDLDPCAAINMPWKTALKMYNKNDDGLEREWIGRVWLNPPYGKNIKKWMEKMANHDNGIALVFARTETNFFFKYIWPIANALLFIKGRIYFYDTMGVKSKGNSGAPSVLVAYGELNADLLELSNINGKYVRLR